MHCDLFSLARWEVFCIKIKDTNSFIILQTSLAITLGQTLRMIETNIVVIYKIMLQLVRRKKQERLYAEGNDTRKLITLKKNNFDYNYISFILFIFLIVLRCTEA